ncbi:MAG: hypothetical protein N2712_03950 [Brevinematales bacterium]|nr:hypothetical protein [Brevinematales bacterium]
MKSVVCNFLTYALILIVPVLSHSISLEEEEIKKAKKVEFENYKGSVKSISIRELINIGYTLAEMSSEEQKVDYNNYYILRVLPTNGLLGADVIFISKYSKVKHINAIRYIITGYLSKQFGYPTKQAFTLSVFVTYYNAFYRSNLDYFKSKYTKRLFYFTSKNIGISTKYYDWPGKTELVIPTRITLRGEKLNLGEVSKKDVIEEIRAREDDLGIKERKELVEIRKKELEEEKKKLEEKEEEIKLRQQNIDKKYEEISEKEEKIKLDQTLTEEQKQKQVKELEEEKKMLEEEKEKLEKEKKKIEDIKSELKSEEEDIKKEEEEIKEDEKRVLAKEEDLQKKAKELKEKEEKLKQKEEELAKLEEKTVSQKAGDKTIFASKMYYLKKQDFEPQAHYNNVMYLIDLSSMKTIKKSSFTNICGSKYYVYADGVVVIGYNRTHSQDHFLVLLDRENVEPKIIGKDNIFWRSFIEFKNDYLYAITITNRRYYLGKFNRNLERIAISDTEVHPDTFITFYDNKIFINDKDKNIIVLDESTMKKVNEIKQ